MPLCLGQVSVPLQLNTSVQPCEQNHENQSHVAQDRPVWPLTAQPGGPGPSCVATDSPAWGLVLRVSVQAEDTAVPFLFVG